MRYIFLSLFLLVALLILNHHDELFFKANYQRARHEVGLWRNAWQQCRAGSGDEWLSRIGDRRIVLGPQPLEAGWPEYNCQAREALNSIGVTLIVSLLEEHERQPGRWLSSWRPVVNYSSDDIWLEVADHAPLEPAWRLHKWVGQLHDALQQQPPHVVYVHCRAGVGRSASLVIAYLMYAERISYREAHAEVKRWRPQISPNEQQRAALQCYGDWLTVREK